MLKSIKPNNKIQEKNAIGYLPVLAAFLGNILIVILKFFGFMISGSGALFSETIHSFADTANQFLLLIGVKRSTKEANLKFSYGYGRERFFWSLISACGIFFIGSGVTVYHGVSSLFLEKEISVGWTTFTVLAISFVVEGGTFLLALRELSHSSPNIKLKEILKNGNPTTLAVLYEDGVAVFGILVAFLSIWLTHITGNHYWDSIGSIIIGALLGIVAIMLINKNREYLIGKTIPKKIQKKIIKILESDPSIEKVIDFKSTILDVGKYRIKCEVEFNGPSLIRNIFPNGFLKKEYIFIKDDYENFLRFCVDYLDKVPRMIGNKINEIEKKIEDEIVEVKHIDIEIN